MQNAKNPADVRGFENLGIYENSTSNLPEKAHKVKHVQPELHLLKIFQQAERRKNAALHGLRRLARLKS